MAELFETYRCLLPCEDDISPEWINKVSTINAFSEFEPFPDEYLQNLDDETTEELIQNFILSIKFWFSQNNLTILQFSELRKRNETYAHGSNPYTWQHLKSVGIDSTKIVCILGNHLLQYKLCSNNVSFLLTALYAAQAYLTMICIPGGNMNSLFDSHLYNLTMETLTNIANLFLKKKKESPKRRHKEDDFPEEEEDVLTIRDKTIFFEAFLDVIDLLTAFLENHELKCGEDEFEGTVEFLVTICQFEQKRGSFIRDFMQQNFASNSVTECDETFIAFKSYMLLSKLCGISDNVSNVEASITMVVKAFVPIIKKPGVLRDHVIEFLHVLIQMYYKESVNAMFLLVQDLFYSAPDRVEGRQKIVTLIWDLMPGLSKIMLQKTVYIAVYMCNFKDSKIRLTTLEFIGKLLLEPTDLIPVQESKQFDDTQVEELVFNYKFLLAVLFCHCQDSSINVKTKVLSILEHLLEQRNIIKSLFDEIFQVPFYINCDKPKNPDAFNRGIFNTHDYFAKNSAAYGELLPGPKIVLDLLEQCAKKGKIFVRNSALKLLSRIYLIYGDWINSKRLEIYFACSNDTSAIIRRTTVIRMTELLNEYPKREILIQHWVKSVIHLSNDDDQKAQEKIREVIFHTIFANLKGAGQVTTAQSNLPWQIVNEIAKQRKIEYLNHIVLKHQQALIVSSSLLRMFDFIWSHVDTKYNMEAWYILVSMSKVMELPKTNLICTYFMNIIKKGTLENPLIIEVLFWSCLQLTIDDKEKLLNLLSKLLWKSYIPTDSISRARDICELLLFDPVDAKRRIAAKQWTADVANANKRRAVEEWSEPHISRCEDYILQCLPYENGTRNFDIEKDKLLKSILLYGDLICAAPKFLSESVDSVLKTELLRDSSKDPVNLNGIKPLIVITLVKLAIVRESFAPQLLEIFNSLLKSTVAANLQINIITGICDLCPRYASLVEPYLPNICLCLKSGYSAVRQTALECLMKKIRDDYVLVNRWNIYPLYTLLLDSCPKVMRQANLFMNSYFKRKPAILEKFYPGFFFFLNNSQKDLDALDMDLDFVKLFAFENDEKKRRKLLLLVLDKLADVTQRIKVTKKIYNDILVPVVNGDIQFDVQNKAWKVLDDVSFVLRRNEIQIARDIKERSKVAVDNNEDNTELEEFCEEENGAKHSLATNLTAILTLRSDAIRDQMDINVQLWNKVKKSRGLREGFVQYFAELHQNAPEVDEQFFKIEQLKMFIESFISNSKHQGPAEQIEIEIRHNNIIVDGKNQPPHDEEVVDAMNMDLMLMRLSDENKNENAQSPDRQERVATPNQSGNHQPSINKGSTSRKKNSGGQGTSTPSKSSSSIKRKHGNSCSKCGFTERDSIFAQGPSSAVHGEPNVESTPTGHECVAGPSGISKSDERRCRYNQKRQRYDDLVERLMKHEKYEKRELVDTDSD